MRIRWPGFVAALVAAGAAHAQAQQEVRISARAYSPAPVAIHVETDLVEVGVVVRSYDGHAIQGLKRENFTVSDQGHAREISYFAVETPGLKGGAPQAAAAPAPGGETAGGATAAAGPNSSATAPRFIALYFEDFATSGADLKRAQIAGRRFIKEGLDDSDHVAIFSTSGDVVDYTNDKAKLIAAVDKLRPHPKYYEAGNGCPRISAYQAYLIASLQDHDAMESAKAESVKCNSADLDAKYTPDSDKNGVGPDARLILSQAELMWGQVRIASQVTLDHLGAAMHSLAKTPGRHLLLLVSAGFNSGTLEIERDRLIDLALRSGIVVNALDAKGLVAEGPGRGMNESVDTVGALPTETFRFEAEALNSRLFLINQPLSDLAEATGGLFFHNNNDLLHGFRKLGSVPDVSYVLGFHRGDAAATDGKYHKLKVSLVDTKSYLVQARPGYFAYAGTPAANKAAPPSARELLDREVTGNSTLTDVPATVAFRLESSKQAGLMTVKAQIHVAIDKLQFPVRDGRMTQQLTLVAALLDASGNVVAGKEGTMDFALTGATFTRLSESGINAGLNLDVPPGTYRLRTVVEEAVNGKMAASTLTVEVK